ncbi:MAG: TIGR03960 family B12-binding radical SAM protein [Proteobacteria bacterium]|nr:TIGR03960 family B12-binding radical SAM protein [Pseudomonadota bacterium]
MSENINALLPFVEKPGRYIGGEVNSIIKNNAEVELRIALAFPDLYEIGTSNLGLQILYNILNSETNIAAERIYAPWTDMEAQLRENSIPLTSLETGTPLSEFDIIGFTLQHELSYTNLLNMLELGGIPLLASERGDNDPIIMAGGPSASNPEPMADFIDIFFIGDGEEGLPDVAEKYMQWKKSGKTDKSRKDLLESLSEVEGVYVPSFFRFNFDAKGKIEAIDPLYPPHKGVNRRILTDLDNAPYPTHFIVPNIRPVHDRAPLEVARGCSRFCRFCQAGYTYLPVRERSAEKVREMGDKAIAATGFDEVALLSLSTGDYSCIETLLPDLTARYSKNHTKLSFPSLRVDTLTQSTLSEMKKGRSNSFTIAPEAGSQRLRDLINKTFTEEQVIETAEEISRAGCQAVKLYFMIGLPTETEEDLDEILRLAEDILKAGRKTGKLRKLTVNISTFVPKPHTPFQWERQLTLEETRGKLKYLKNNIKNRAISLRWQEPVMSILEGVFSRGDRRLGKAILCAYKKGARFDSWTEKINFTLWQEVFKDEGIIIEDYLGERSKDAILPWAKVNIGVTREFFLKELEKAHEGALTMDCRYKNCSACGVCDHKVVKIENFIGRSLPEAPHRKQDIPKPHSRFRIRYGKSGNKRFLGHIDTMHEITRMVRRANIPTAYTEGFRPSPKISFSSPIPLGTESLSEYFDIEIEEIMQADLLMPQLKTVAPAGIDIMEVSPIMINEPSLTKAAREERYRVRVQEEGISKEDIVSSIQQFHSQEKWPILKNTKKGKKELDLKKEILAIAVDKMGEISLSISTKEARRVRAEDAVANILKLDDNQKKRLSVLKVETVFDTIGKNI